MVAATEENIRETFAMTTTVEVLAAAFRDAGTPFIVGHPGGESVELMEAARQRQMRFLLMKQEVAGAMLAATWGDLTGSPGICLSTRGPGAANMVNGVAHAFLDRSPLIAITDTYSRTDREVEHCRRRQDGAPASAPRHAHGNRDAAGPGAFRVSAERDHARSR
jgi:acetolactate synthase-1/2/3 large subunit